MIVKENQLLNQFDGTNINYQPILLYGPNEGLIRENLDTVNNSRFKNVRLMCTIN